MRFFVGLATSLVLAAPLVACGGKTVLILGDVDAAAEPADAVAPLHDGPVSPPATCPVNPEVLSGCSSEGLTCPGTLCEQTTSCSCTNGVWACEPVSCKAPPPTTCPKPSTIDRGEACPVPGITCMQSVCSGVTNPCICTSQGWQCVGVSCGSGPGMPIVCAVGAPCAGGPASCTLSGAGPCGSDELLGCREEGAGSVYGVLSFPCSGEGDGCGTAGPGCSSSCTCENGQEVCSGDCEDAGAGEP